MQAKVKIAYRAAIDNAQRNDCALMRVNNYREARVEDGSDPLANNSVDSTTQ